MKSKIYQQIFIKSREDLPENENEYFVGFKNGNIGTMSYWNPLRFPHNQDSWLRDIDWYLQKVNTLTDEEIEEEADHWLEIVETKRENFNRDSFIFCAGAKFARQRLIE